MIDARTQTRREGKKGLKNGLLKMGSPMSQWGLTPHIPSDLEESGHRKDGPNAYRLQPSPYGLSGRNAPCAEELSPFLSIVSGCHASSCIPHHLLCEEKTDPGCGYRAWQPSSVYNAGPPLRGDWGQLWGAGIQSWSR